MDLPSWYSNSQFLQAIIFYFLYFIFAGLLKNFWIYFSETFRTGGVWNEEQFLLSLFNNFLKTTGIKADIRHNNGERLAERNVF